MPVHQPGSFSGGRCEYFLVSLPRIPFLVHRQRNCLTGEPVLVSAIFLFLASNKLVSWICYFDVSILMYLLNITVIPFRFISGGREWATFIGVCKLVVYLNDYFG